MVFRQQSGVAAALIAAALLLDRGLKQLVRLDWSWHPGESVGLWLTKNEGIAFSLPLPSVLTSVLIGAALVLLVALGVRRWRRGGDWLPFGCLVAGGASNLFDRWRFGSVTDYLHLGALPVLNVADLGVLLGLLMFVHEALTQQRSVHYTRG